MDNTSTNQRVHIGDENLESAFIGSLLIDPGQVKQFMSHLKPEDFFFLRFSYVYQAMVTLAEQKLAMDTTIIKSQMVSDGTAEALFPGQKSDDYRDLTGWLGMLVATTPNSNHAPVYAQMIKRLAFRRNGKTMTSRIDSILEDETLNTTDVQTKIDEMFRDWMRTKIVPEKTWTERVYAVVDRLEARWNGLINPLPSGIAALDQFMGGGYEPNTLNVIAGRPGHGKTSFMTQLVINWQKMFEENPATFNHGNEPHVAFWSGEMDIDQITRRMTSQIKGITGRAIKTPKNRAEMTAALDGMSDISRWGWFRFEHKSETRTIEEFSNKLHQWQSERPLDAIMIDYLQLMESLKPFYKEYDKVTYISKFLKELAGTFQVPVFAAAQLNRDLEQRQNKRPMISDLRSSGQIEQDGDVIQFIYRDVLYDEATMFPNDAEMIFAKFREDKTGTVRTYFESSSTSFHNATQRELDLGDRPTSHTARTGDDSND